MVVSNIFFYVHPDPWGDDAYLLGWFNHQLGKKPNMKSKNDGFPIGVSFCRCLFSGAMFYLCVGVFRASLMKLIKCIGNIGVNIPT